MDGILLVDKPLGWTSFDVVAKVRGIGRKEGPTKFKVGHTGTLDPLSTGLLILMLGNYTKKSDNYLKLDKDYLVDLCFGRTSSTGDAQGEKKVISGVPPTQAAVEKTLKKFTGSIEQIPPVYSAIKIDGQRAYKLARKGIALDMQPRTVEIKYITQLSYVYPFLVFETGVSSGTYIRSLVEDIGKALGVGAYTSGLRRTRVGQFSVNDAISAEQLDEETIKQHLIVG